MCTTICLRSEKRIVLANNEDIFLENGMVFTNHVGIKKTALIMPPEKPLQWVSRYGSMTFSQCGKEFPSAGMNTAGLAIEQMTLLETVYPALDEKPAVKELQLIQFLLDTCGTVDEGLEAMKQVRVSQAACPIHYMLCDRQGNSAVAEYLNGELQIYRNGTLGVKALSNSPYAESMHFHENPALAGNISDPYKKNSIDRFLKAADFLSQMPDTADDLVGCGFDALEAVKRDDTVWRIVYDVNDLRVYFSTKRFQIVKYFDLHDFDFSRDAAPKVLDMSVDISGNTMRQFRDYTTDLNRTLVYAFFKNPLMMQVMRFDLSDDILNYLAAYPDEQ